MKLLKLTVRTLTLAASLVTVQTIFADAGNPNILLTVDISDIHHVTFTATGNAASANNNSTTAGDGITLQGFFNADTGYSSSATGTLQGGNSGANYTTATSDNIGGGSPRGGLNFYAGSVAAQNFSVSTPALTGTVTLDLGSVAARLQTAGLGGNLTAGYSGNLGPVIGQWKIKSPYYSQTLVIDNFKDGSSFTLSDTSGTAKFNNISNAVNIIGGSRQIRVRAAGSGFYGPSTIAVDTTADTLSLYGTDTSDRLVEYGSSITAPGIPVSLNLNLNLASSLSFNVSNAPSSTSVIFNLSCGDGNTRTASLTINGGGAYSIPLTNFPGLTAAEAGDIDGIIVSTSASATTAAQGLILTQLSFTAVYPPPALGIGTYVGQPAVYFPTFPGTNYVLQMTTNLTSGNWVTVTNGIPLSGVIITNAPANAFFRLQ